MREGIVIHLLGPVTADAGDAAPLDLGPARQRATLAVLACAAARPVPMDRIVAGIWGLDAPRTAEQSVYTYIAGLRRVFEPGRGRREPSRILAGTPAGYVLDVPPAQVDALAFAGQVAEAREAAADGAHPRALRLLDLALARWRGTALSGLPGPFAEAERARLTDLRLAALERRAESLLELGRHAEAADELRDLVRRHPLRERARELLMTALFRSGRRAEALEVYEEGRVVLAEALGLSPGEGLRRCQAMILRADALAAGDDAPTAPAPLASPHRPSPHAPSRPTGASADGPDAPSEPGGTSTARDGTAAAGHPAPPPHSPSRTGDTPTAGDDAAAAGHPAPPLLPPGHGPSRTGGVSTAGGGAEAGSGSRAGAEPGSVGVAGAGSRAQAVARGEGVGVGPRQLPRPLAGFVGRGREVGRLRARLAPADGSPPGPLVVVTGPPGVGKSALAAHVAHLVARRFPGGQLYVNCRGATPDLPALTASDLLGRFLRGLSVPPEAVPADLDEAAAAWRSRLHGRPVLAVLDDAADLAQIRPLLGVPFGSVLLVTSRESMAWGEDAFQVELGRLSGEEAAAMLAGLAGAPRIAADVAETGRLVRLCDGLPLALRIAGARLAARPGWSVAALADRLSDERRRLNELSAGDLAVRSSLASGHAALARGTRPVDRLAARALALLGALHVPDVTAAAAAALLGVPVAEAEQALERLVDAHLLDGSGSGRYQPHDLVRLFAAELRPEGVDEALVRVLSYYAASTRHASEIVDPHRVQPAAPVAAEPHPLAGAAAARAWLDEEEAVLLAAARQALASPDPALARLGVNLTFGLHWSLSRTHGITEMRLLNTLALQVCERLGDEPNAMLAHGHVASALSSLTRTDEAVAHFQAQQALARRLGAAFTEMSSSGNIANALIIGERFEEALPWARRQLEVATRIGSRVGVRYALSMIGKAHLGAGRPELAREPLSRAVADAVAVGDVLHEGQMRFSLGELLLTLNDPRGAERELVRSVELCAETGYRVGLLRALIDLSHTYRLLGRPRRALECVTRAEETAGGLRNSRWERRLADERAAVTEAVARADRATPQQV
ncbi:AAA family ATPase [Actinomadura sp. ATCC 31491]|uniref:AAA family ATPase n=1 Tax=Actinomadura luzonensis TaxID=2805427 RepID=A0ABT0G7Q0_9ACTN|nr:BTAD domain-containing putative transcriptional regulator [Actinomadura luzonensis]MCK2220544.1 AAA family ATPase [Actinomadura luzonensis]